MLFKGFIIKSNFFSLQNLKSYYKAFSKYSIGRIMVDVAFDILVLL